MDRIALVLYLGDTRARSMETARECERLARRVLADEEIAQMERLAHVCAGRVAAHQDDILIVRGLLPGHGPPRGRIARAAWTLARVLSAVADALR